MRSDRAWALRGAGPDISGLTECPSRAAVCRRCVTWLAGVVLSVSGLAHRGGAQRTGGHTESTPQVLTEAGADTLPLQLSPHQLLFDATTHTATLEVHNASVRPLQATLQVLYAYPDWPHGLPADTMLFTEHWEQLYPHDTVIASPGPTDHFAGRWLSGIPAAVTLAPHQTQRLTVRLTPPSHLPLGAYWARLVAVIHSPEPHPGASRDVQQRYAIPTKGNAQVFRDSAEVIYRHGPMTMGLAIGPVVAQIDEANRPGPPHEGGGRRQLWLRVPLHLTGTAPFEGVVHLTYRNLTTGEETHVVPIEFSLYRDAVTHWWAQTEGLPAGSYAFVLRFDSPQSDVPPAKRIPMTPVQVTVPFTLKPFWAY